MPVRTRPNPPTRNVYGAAGKPTPAAAPRRSAAWLNAYSDDGPPPFSPLSPWNTRIPDSARVDPKSAAIMAVAFDSDRFERSLGAAIQTRGVNVSTERYEFGNPFWYGDAGTPLLPVNMTNEYGGTPGPYAFGPLPIPPQAVPAKGSDHIMMLLDLRTNTYYEFFHMYPTPGDANNMPIPGTPVTAWSSPTVHAWDATGMGHQPWLYDGGGLPVWQRGNRAYGGAGMAGVIRYWEARRGVIPHALGWTHASIMNKHFAMGLGVDGVSSNIGSSADGDYSNAAEGYPPAGGTPAFGNRPEFATDRPHQVPPGARIRMKASVDVEARTRYAALNRVAARAIGVALQQYGAFMVDRGGGFSFIGEDLTGKSVRWCHPDEAMTDEHHKPWVLGPAWEDVYFWTADDFEVMSLPAVLGIRPYP